MEMIGVMAIMAILAAVLAPSLTGAINDAFAQAEGENLEAIAEALELSIRRNGAIPSGSINDWTVAVAAMSDLAADQIATNRRGRQRVLLFDPDFLTAGGGFSGYTQTGGLASAPLSPRALLISNFTGNVSVSTSDAGAFDSMWNQAAGAPYLESETLHIHRINLRPLFKEVVLTSESSNMAAMSLNNAASVAVPAASGAVDGAMTRYVLADSRMLLYGDPYPTGGVETVYKVTDDLGLRFVDLGTDFGWVQP